MLSVDLLAMGLAFASGHGDQAAAARRFGSLSRRGAAAALGAAPRGEAPSLRA